MILKAKHLYRLDYINQEYYKDIEGYRGYCLVSPTRDIESFGCIISSYVHMDVFGRFNTDSSIYFGGGWKVIKPSISDVFEILQYLQGKKYKYDFKTNKIILK